MKRILLDANFLTIPYYFRIDIFEEIGKLMEEKYEMVTLDKIVEELERLAKKGGKSGVAAKIGLELIRKKKIKLIKTEGGRTDELIERIANKDFIVATNDAELRRKLKEKGIKTIYLRAKKHLILG